MVSVMFLTSDTGTLSAIVLLSIFASSLGVITGKAANEAVVGV